MEEDQRCNDRLDAKAYVAVEGANCYYEPRRDSAVRMIPPYGSEVVVVSQSGSWVKVRWSGKEAWSHRASLSATFVASKSKAWHVNIVPAREPWFANLDQGVGAKIAAPQIEVGPRGGRFVRRPSGEKRYL
nr:hypothetical protein [Novosphingobium panipatense]